MPKTVVAGSAGLPPADSVGLDLDVLEAETKRIPVAYAGHTFQIDYWPHRYSSDVQEMVEAYREERGYGKIRKVIADIVAGWTITRGGAPVPVTEDELRKFPMPMAVAIGTAIMNDVWAVLTAPDDKDPDEDIGLDDETGEA